MATPKARKKALPTKPNVLLENDLEVYEYGKDVEEARAALAEVEREGTVSWDEVKSYLADERPNSPQRHREPGKVPKPKTQNP